MEDSSRKTRHGIAFLLSLVLIAIIGSFIYINFFKDDSKPIDNGGGKETNPTPTPEVTEEPVTIPTPTEPPKVIDNGEEESDYYILYYDKVPNDGEETSPDAIDLTKTELTNNDQTFNYNNNSLKIKNDGKSLYINDKLVNMDIKEEWYIQYIKEKYNLYWKSDLSHAILTANIDFSCPNIVVGTIDSNGNFEKIKYVPDSRYGSYMIDRIACLGRIYTKDGKIYGQYTFDSLYVKKGDKAPIYRVEFDI